MDNHKNNNAPTHSAELEQAVLACCMMPDCATESLAECVERGVSVSSFYNQKHATIWDAIVQINRKGHLIDEISVGNYLNERGEIESIGGWYFLSQVSDTVHTKTGLKRYIEALKDYELRRAMLRLCRKAIEDLQSGDKDVRDVCIELDKSIIENRQHELSSSTTARDVFSQFRQNIGSKKSRGISTGLPTLDNVINGLSGGQMIVIAARPGNGKTALGINIADAVASSGVPVGFFQLEMTCEEMASRFVSARSRVMMRSFDPEKHTDAVKERIYDSIENLAKMPIYFDDRASNTIEDIHAKATLFKRRHNIGLVIIDYLQLVRTQEKLRRFDAVGEVSRTIKRIAKDLNIPVIALAQLNREVEKENRPPRVSDLRESGDIEQDADVILLIDNKKTAENVENDIWDIIVGKQRGGAAGSSVRIPVRFVKYITRFFDVKHEESNRV